MPKATAKAATPDTITIPQMKRDQILVRIKGLTPLLTNRFSEKAIEDIERTQSHGPKGAKEPRDPQADFAAACHVIAPGLYGFPSAGIKKALVAAGFRFADEKGTVLRGIINIPQNIIPIEAPEPTMRTDPVRLANGKFTIAYRPEFFPWEMNVPVDFNSAMIGGAQILNLFQIAGFSVGIGSWRPECNGTCGQFTLADDVGEMAA